MGYWTKIKVFYTEYPSAVISWIIFFGYVVGGVIGTCIIEDINPIKSLYFVISTMTTTGNFNLTTDASSPSFIGTSLYAIFGILITSVAIVYMSQFTFKNLMYERLQLNFNDPITVSEVESLKQIEVLHAEDIYSIKLSQQEYLILMAIRMDLIDVKFISKVLVNYRDHSQSSSLEIRKQGSIEIPHTEMSPRNIDELSSLLP